MSFRRSSLAKTSAISSRSSPSKLCSSLMARYPVQVGLRVPAHAARSAAGRRDQPDLLVVAEGSLRNAGSSGCRPNAQQTLIGPAAFLRSGAFGRGIQAFAGPDGRGVVSLSGW